MRESMWVSLILAFLAVPASGQDVPGPDPYQVSVLAGALRGAGELESDTEFESGPAYGAAFTYWAEPWLGVRARALRADPGLSTGDFVLTRVGAPDVWLLGADFVLRRPFLNRGRTIAPYLAVGGGAKRYGFDDPYHAPAVQLGGGVEVSVAGFGVFGEATHVLSEFNRLGFQEGNADWVFAGGLSLSFGGPEPEPLAVDAESS